MLALMLKGTLVFSVLWALSWASPAAAAETKKVRLGILTSGSQDLIHNVMERQKLLDKYNVPYERIKVLNPAPLHLFLAEKRVDIGYGGVTAMARARAEGKDMVIIYGIFSPVNAVLVKKESSIQSFAALKGKRIGNFGGPGSATTSMLMAISKKWYGMDLQRETELITAPGPALAGLLDKDQLAAALVGNQESVTLPLTGKYRVLLDMSEEWEKRAGRAPATVTLATNEEFAKANPDLLRRYLRAYVDAVRYIRTHSEIWKSYGESVGITTKEGVAALQKTWGPRILEKWDRQQMEVQRDFLEAVKEILGPKVLKAVPEDLMTDAYNP
ncbi:MAG: ABC transporter substrate-binding protein [Deltaproteobacteria bacterium]|nr:ABC transporter substrate-binding protein [Deltaproteobacteria bacterium]